MTRETDPAVFTEHKVPSTTNNDKLTTSLSILNLPTARHSGLEKSLRLLPRLPSMTKRRRERELGPGSTVSTTTPWLGHPSRPRPQRRSPWPVAPAWRRAVPKIRRTTYEGNAIRQTKRIISQRSCWWRREPTRKTWRLSQWWVNFETAAMKSELQWWNIFFQFVMIDKVRSECNLLLRQTLVLAFLSIQPCDSSQFSVCFHRRSGFAMQWARTTSCPIDSWSCFLAPWIPSTNFTAAF